MAIRNVETWLRKRRVGFTKLLAGSARGRKLLLDALPENVVEVTVDCGDHRITVSPHEMIGRHVIAGGGYDREAVTVLLEELDRRKLLPPGGASLLEIGANIGTHTLYLALTGRFERIVAVEPDPRNLRLLERNIEENGLEGVVRIAACAAGDVAGEATLSRTSGNFGNSSLARAEGRGDGVTVPVKPVADILREASLAAEDVSLVWMDIEGFEPQATRSMPALLARRVPLYLEFSPEFYGPDGTRDFAAFLSAHYRDCVIFRKGSRQQARVSDLGSINRQCDVLLF